MSFALISRLGQIFVVCLGGEVGISVYFFFRAEDGIRGLVRSRGLGDVYKRQADML